MARTSEQLQPSEILLVQALDDLPVDATKAIAKSGAATLTQVSVAAGSSWAFRETPSGTVDGSNPTFTLAHTPVVGSESVFLNGILLDSGANNDYTISGATITMINIPQSNDKLRVTYQY